MKQPPTQSIRREDIVEAPNWIAKLLAPLNTFIDAVSSGLNKGVTFDENISCLIKDITFTTSATYSTGTWVTVQFPREISGKVKGVLIIDLRLDTSSFSPVTSAVGVSWQEIQEKVRIEYISGLANSTSYKAKLLVI